MTLEEAEWISRNRLPDEPRDDEITAWRASRPPPEPPKRARGLDTTPAPQVDWALVIRQTILGERAHMTEAIGGAIAEYGDGILAEVEQMIAQAADQVRTELRAEIGQMREEFFNRVDMIRGQGSELRAEFAGQLEQLRNEISGRRRAKAAKPIGSRLMLPGPNGNAQHGPQ